MDFNKTLDFLIYLKENNNKEWFDINRKLYKDISAEFKIFAQELILGISSFDNKVLNINPKDCVFRINRDIRFSTDKSPYKTNFGAFIVPGGKKSGNAGYYFHIEPNNCFIAGGIHMPAPDKLKLIRKNIYENFNDFKSIITEDNFVKNFKSISAERLINPPKGFPKDFEGIDFLKFKSFTVIKPIKETELNENILAKTFELFKTMKPFNDFLNGY